MTVLATQLPARRADLVIRPIGKEGRYVVKLPGTHDYFHLGEEEHFLLTQLDGERDTEAWVRPPQSRSGCLGIVIVNSAPLPGVEDASIEPPWASTTFLEIARPSPVPASFEV